MIDNYYYKNKIIFPNTLDLTKDMDYDKKKKQKFNLIGIINHIGEENVGHYTAYCKNFYDELWYEFNDQFVDEIEFSNKSKNVMLLFYERIEL